MVGMDGLWPSQQDAPGFQDSAEAFMAHCHRVSEQLLGSFATGLGLEPDFFNRVSSWPALAGSCSILHLL